MTTAELLAARERIHSPELWVACLELLEPASAQAWGAWFDLCERAQAAGIAIPEIGDNATMLELCQAYREMRREVDLCITYTA